MLPAVVDDVGDLQLGRAKLVISRTWKNCDLNSKKDIVSKNKCTLVFKRSHVELSFSKMGCY